MCDHREVDDCMFCTDCGECREDLDSSDLCMDCGGIDENEKEINTIKQYQELINSGQAWLFEGAVGRQAMYFIDAGLCMLGEEGHYDYYGNYVPSRHEVKPGTKGSAEYCERMQSDIED